MAKDVKVRFIAQDEVSAALRGMSGKIESFGKGMLKVAAGLGLADSFKRIGMAIRDSIVEAAAAYPKLGAGLKTVSDKFTEFRVQAGAAFLEVLQPAVPLLTSILDWATKLAVKIPDAFDGFKIAMIEVSGWFAELPSRAEIMFGELAQKAAGFITSAGAVASFLGMGSGPELAANLNAYSLQVVANAKKTMAGIEAETDRLIAKYSGGHDLGPRAPGAATEAAQKAAEQALLGRNSYNPKPTVIDNRIPLRPMDTSPITGDAGNVTPSGVRYDAMDQFAAGLESVIGPLGEVHDLSQQLNATLGEMAGLAAGALTDSFATFFEQLGAGQATIGDFAKAMVKGIASAAVSEGRIGMAKGFAKMAEALWPYNPVAFTSGLKMVGTNAALISVASALGSIGGGGQGSGSGGSAGYAGSGSLSSANVSQASRDLATRGKLIINVKDGVIGTRSPEFRDMIADIVREAGALRELEIQST